MSHVPQATALRWPRVQLPSGPKGATVEWTGGGAWRANNCHLPKQQGGGSPTLGFMRPPHVLEPSTATPQNTDVCKVQTSSARDATSAQLGGKPRKGRQDQHHRTQAQRQTNLLFKRQSARKKGHCQIAMPQWSKVNPATVTLSYNALAHTCISFFTLTLHPIMPRTKEHYNIKAHWPAFTDWIK